MQEHIKRRPRVPERRQPHDVLLRPRRPGVRRRLRHRRRRARSSTSCSACARPSPRATRCATRRASRASAPRSSGRSPRWTGRRRRAQMTALMRAAIVGAGPSGFYAAAQLLTSEEPEFEVDLFDRLPTPFGLVRAGVAPDHPKIKAVTRVYEKTAQHRGFRFFGGVELGARRHAPGPAGPLPRGALRGRTATDNRSASRARTCPARTRPPSSWPGTTATPTTRTTSSTSRAKRVVVIGNGNVAVDVARMLVLDPRRAGGHRHRRPRDRAARRGRGRRRSSCSAAAAPRRPRSPPRAARAGRARRARTSSSTRPTWSSTRTARTWLETEDDHDATSATSRSCASTPQREPHGKPSAACDLRFLRSPVEILGEARTAAVTGVRIERNEIVEDGRAVATGEEEVIACGLVIRSIGYRGAPLAGIPFDERRGLIPNQGGRVVDRRRARGRRVRHRLGQARPVRRHRHEQEGRADTVARSSRTRAAGKLNRSPDADDVRGPAREQCPSS